MTDGGVGVVARGANTNADASTPADTAALPSTGDSLGDALADRDDEDSDGDVDPAAPSIHPPLACSPGAISFPPPSTPARPPTGRPASP